MEIRNAAHKGMKLLLAKNDSSKLPAEYAEKVRSIVSALRAMEDIGEFLRIPRGRPHALKGDRKGEYAITVYANWRLTFRYDAEAKELYDLNLEDYH